MEKKFQISASPHLRDKITTSNIMLMVCIALLPTSLFSVYHFGLEALLIIIITTGSAITAEAVYCKITKKEKTVGDYSAALTGLLLALNLPPSATWWMCILGSVFAIIVVKQLFGGIGQNIMNPALAARAFLVISFTGKMTNFAYDAYTGATPLAQLKYGQDLEFSFMDMFIGTTPGVLGETSAIALLIGAAFLLYLKIIDLRIPGSAIVSFVAFLAIFGGQGFDVNFILMHLLGGGFMIGVWFMATDYVTSPITKKGQIIYGCCIGILTAIFRIYGGSAEGISFAIIFSNLLVPLIEKFTIPKPFGRGGK